MLEAKLLRKLTDPFLLPFTDALYIQTTALGVKVCTLYLIFNKEKVFINFIYLEVLLIISLFKFMIQIL